MPGIRILIILTIALGIRVAFWALIPVEMVASDESTYYHAGLRLLTEGVQDVFFPPLTSWIIALTQLFSEPPSIKAARFFWVVLDTGNVLLLYLLTLGLTASTSGNRIEDQSSRHHAPWRDDNEKAAILAALFYTFYIPALKYSQFATSEVPALFLLLASLNLIIYTRNNGLFSPVSIQPESFKITCAYGSYFFVGILFGLVTLARGNLALVGLSIACLLWFENRSLGKKFAGILFWCICSGLLLPIGSYMLGNYLGTGRLIFSQNVSYNLYIGNADVYQEDLNLFWPFASPEQCQERQRMLQGSQRGITLNATEMRKAAVQNILNSPVLFLRRALGRLARIFGPKTAPLALLGGERKTGIFSLGPLFLLGLSALQYAFILFLGIAGIFLLLGDHSLVGKLFSVTILSSLPLCLIAISKPRYSFPFEPVLIIAAVWFMIKVRQNLHRVWSHYKIPLLIIYGFLIWSWLAWLIFSFSSRLKVYGG
ncbi:hypothetical protein ACFL27_14085 [candidate division CSSED10-310 bacterium]|uniref:Glycosyltransferase RgtA/B/C/D-like domain-containing protein n=1 Tax=candidate division CSSED10-310 bacterium TaxID=2855610 RepID=A0ABV6YYR0_UNCC1